MTYPMAAPFLRGLWRTRRIASVIAVAWALTGCVDLPSMVFTPPPIEMTSPIRSEVEAASTAKVSYPRWSDVPLTAPTDIRPTTAWTRNIYDTLRLRRQQQALAALYPQILFDAPGFAYAGKAFATPPGTPGQVSAQPAASDDYAKAQRALATPPSSTH
jgi:hypothetical protein